MKRGRARVSSESNHEPFAGRSAVKSVNGTSGIASRLKLFSPLLVLTVVTLGAAGRLPSILLICTGLAVAGLLLNRPPINRSLVFLWWTGMFFLGWQLLTLLPLPLHSLGNPRLELFEQAHDKLAELESVLEGVADASKGDEFSFADGEFAFDERRERRDYGRVTLNRSGTMRFITILLGAWGMFWLSTALTREQRMRFLAFLVAGGTVVAVLGIVGQHLVSPENRIWWLYPIEHRVAAGPFVNRNHFASFCAMLTPVALSLVLAPFPLFGADRAGRFRNKSFGDDVSDQYHTGGRSSLREESLLLGWWRDLTSMGRWRLFYGLCLAVLVAAPILSLSRGGMVMMLAGCLTASLFWVRGKPALALTGAVLMLVVLFAFLLWPSEQVQERISSLHRLQGASPRRVEMTREAWRQWQDFSWLGGGADSFRTLNGLYRNEPATKSPLYTENEYVQLLADHGVLGVLFFLILLASLAIGFWGNFYERYRRTRSLRVLRGSWARDPEITRRHRELYPPVIDLSVLAAVSGVVVGLLFHISCDFPLRVPLNSFLAAALLGLIMPLPREGRAERFRFWRCPLLVLLVLTVVVLFSWSGKQMKLDEPTYLQNAGMETLTQAVAGAPSYWVAWSELSQRARRQARQQLRGEGISLQDRFDPFQLYHFGVECLEVAAELNPYDPRLWRALSRARMQDPLGNEEGVESALRRAAVLSPHDRRAWNEWLDFVKSGRRHESILQVAELAKEEAGSAVAVRMWREIRSWAQEGNYTSYHYRAVKVLSDLQPERSQWWEERAEMEARMASREEAIESRRRLTELKPDDWRNWKELGKLLLRERRNEAANRAFSRVVRLRPDKREDVERVWREIRLEE